jgi:hypothetical protein
MAKLTYKARENLGAGAFVFPKDRRYPIHDRAHARNALARASGKSEESAVKRAVHSRYPDIGKEKTAYFMEPGPGESVDHWKERHRSMARVNKGRVAFKGEGKKLTALHTKTAAVFEAFADELAQIAEG